MPASSGTLKLAGGASVGRSLTAFTMNAKACVVVLVSASTAVNVTIQAPNWFVAGVSVTVRFAPVPLRAMFAAGRRFVFDDVAVNERLVVEVSPSASVT